MNGGEDDAEKLPDIPDRDGFLPKKRRRSRTFRGRRTHDDTGEDREEVIRMQKEFYRAMNQRNIRRMRPLWYDGSSEIQCVRPQFLVQGNKPVVGYDAVVKTWAQMFQMSNSNKDDRVKRSKTYPQSVHVVVQGTTALVTCVEEIQGSAIVGDPSPPPRWKGTATSLYRKKVMYDQHSETSHSKWLLVHHHASLCQGVSGGSLGEGTRLQLGGAKLSGELGGLSGDLAGLASSLGADGGKIIVIESDGDEDVLEDDDLASALMDQLKSMGGSSSSSSGRKSNSLQHGAKTVVVERSNDSKDQQTTEPGLVAQSAGSGGGTSALAGGDEGGGGGRNDMSAIQERVRAEIRQRVDQAKAGEEDREGQGLVPYSAERRELLQRTITTVRRLGDQGRLSPRQKSALLTDMIQRAHAHGQQQPGPSVAEVAFDLLVGVDEDIDACLEGGAFDTEVTNAESDTADHATDAAVEAAEAEVREQEEAATAAMGVDTKFDDMMGLEARVEDFAQQCRVFADQLAASQTGR